LWFLLGLFGAHRFYLEKIGTGILFFFTGGVLGIGWIIDLFTLGIQVDNYNKMHGGKQNQNVFVNVNIPEILPKNDVNKISVPQITQSSALKINAEKTILAIAENEPILTLRKIIVKSDLEMEEAENALNKLVAKGIAKM
jgi:TM2 domain-containing membrane protein YozV